MAPKGSGVETPDSVEQEHPTEIQPEKPAEPPFTEEERLTQQAGNIDETLKGLRPAAQEDKQNLGQTEETFQREFPEPPAKFTEEPHTVQEVKDLEGQQQAIQQQLENSGSENANEPPSAEEPAAEPAERQAQPEPEIPEGPKPEEGKVAKQPKAKIRPRLPREAPIAIEATREQMAEQFQQELEKALDKIYTKIEATGQLPEDLTELKNISKGTLVISDTTISSRVEQLKKDFATFQREEKRIPSLEEFRTLGVHTFKEQIGQMAKEDPHEVQKSPHEKQQDERRASHQPGQAGEIPTQGPPMPPQPEGKSRVSRLE